MNNKKVLLIGFFLSLPIAVPLRAATFRYDAVVTFLHGPHSTVFRVGERVVISYTLNPRVVDADRDPRHGVFHKAVQALSVSFPDSGIVAAQGPGGGVGTFDNVVDPSSGALTDQVFLNGGRISRTSLLEGEPISFLEVDFLSQPVFPPSEPTLLTSDALPVFKLPTDDATLFLRTSSGFTQIDFEGSSTFVPDVSGCLSLRESPVAGRRVTLTQKREPNQVAITDANGCYEFASIVSGKSLNITISGLTVP